MLLGVACSSVRFIAVMVGCVLVLYQAATLGVRRQWALSWRVRRRRAVGAVSLQRAAVNHRSGGQIVYVGMLNPVAHRAVLGIFLSFGPCCLPRRRGPAWRRALGLAVLALAVASASCSTFSLTSSITAPMSAGGQPPVVHGVCPVCRLCVAGTHDPGRLGAATIANAVMLALAASL